MQQILAEYISKYKPLIDKGIADELDRRMREVGNLSPLLIPVISAMKELSVGGKRLRAILTIIGYEKAGGVVDNEIIHAGVAMEIFHLALLIQDDVMDRDNLRREVTTIHARYSDLHLGEAVAVLASDSCNGYVIEILTGLKLDPQRVIAAISLWGKYFCRVSYGQTLDVMTEARGDVSESEILQVLSLKSGEYTCVMPLLLGATLATASGQQLSQLEKYGMELGWVFQLRDDYLAEYGESKKTGKPVGNDSREGKKTIVTMYGKKKAQALLLEHMQKSKELIGDNELLEAIIEYVGTRDN
ncbi:MAG: polyprenyl synthetase family protein [bacterium]